MTLPHPRILITTRSLFQDLPMRRTTSLTGQNYSEAVAEAGGLPFMVSNLAPELAESYMASVDGLLLSGGSDIDPQLYGQEPHQKLELVEPERDAFELALYHAAKAQGKPILGICRGIQVINVAEGGDLHQDLSSLEGTIQHSQRHRGDALSHELTLEPDSLLARTLGRTRFRSNSFHHQAVDRVGRGLKVTARSADGVIEALEGSGEGFIMGLQWHPEMSFHTHPEQALPFRLFLEAIRKQALEGVPS